MKKTKSLSKIFMATFFAFAMLFTGAMFVLSQNTQEVYAEITPNYLTLTAKGGTAEITFKYYEGTNAQYSLNGGTWTNCKEAQNETGDVFTLTENQYIQFKGTNVYTKSLAVGDTNVPYHFSMIAKTEGATVEASGDVTSLTNGVGGDAELTYTSGEYAFMFFNCTILTKAPNLPSTTLADGCYSNMFKGCSSLANAPELPAETLTTNCYSNMFNDCSKLVSAPELPAETLTKNCYSGMFSGCTSLVSAPELPAKTLAINCYASMFYGCTSLTVAPELPATTLADNCYHSMFYNCSKLTVAPALPATEMAESCYSSMFRLSSILKPVDISHVTSLAKQCFYYMYYECTKIGMSATRQAGYTIEWQVPNISTATDWNTNMFLACGSNNCCDTNNDGSAVTVNTTYYVAKYYNIAYDLNGGSGTTPTDDNIYRVGDNIDLNDGTDLSNGDKTFKGWNGSSLAIDGRYGGNFTIFATDLPDPDTGDTITF